MVGGDGLPKRNPFYGLKGDHGQRWFDTMKSFLQPIVETECLVRCTCTIAALACAFGQQAAAADKRVRNWPSPDQRLTLSSEAVGGDEEPEYQLLLQRPAHPPVVIDTFLRDIDVAWNPDSAYVAVTNWIGSNVADCYLIDITKPTRRLSMGRNVPKLPESPENSHFYVSCGQWLDNAQIQVRVSGHTDTPPYHEFAYDFVFDVTQNHLRKR